MSVQVELNSVTKRYGDFTAVDSLSLVVERGECLCLLGPSGCGKTTTLNMIAGFVRPDAGTISIAGASVERKPPHKRDIGIVFQNHALFPHMSVQDNVAFGLRMRHVPRAEIARRVRKVLEVVKLDGFENRQPHGLSGGQQQRVALARALAIEPSILLLDEPLSSLDAQLRAEMRIELVDILDRVGITAIFVTHDQEEALTIADRIVVMNRGRIQESGEPEDIYRTPTTLFGAGFVGASNLLPGSVSATDGECVELALDIDRGQRVLAKANGAEPVGSRVVLLLRPEQLSLSAERTPAANALRGRVRSVQFLGPVVRYTFEEPLAGLTATVANVGDKPRFEIGEDVYLEWDTRVGTVLNAAG